MSVLSWFGRWRAWRACLKVILSCMGRLDFANASVGRWPSNWFFRSWQTDEGLPGHSVTGLAHTGDGCMWLGTRAGLMRFNGNAFTGSATIPAGRPYITGALSSSLVIVEANGATGRNDVTAGGGTPGGLGLLPLPRRRRN